MKRLLLVTIILLPCVSLFSQGPPGGPSPPFCWPPPCIPIDGGIGIFTLLAAYLGYKFYNKSTH